MFTWPRRLILGLFQAVRSAEILFFFASFSCQPRDGSEANSEDLSQNFLILRHPSAFSHYFSSNKRHAGT